MKIKTENGRMNLPFREKGHIDDVMKLRAMKVLRAPRLCNPPALQLSPQGIYVARH
jgi:hypothetical protein